MIEKMSGGAPLEIDGRTLDLRTHFICAQGAKAPPISTSTPDAARKAAHDAFKLTNAARVGGVMVWDDTIPAPDGTALPVRHYRPKGKKTEKLPGVLYFHMGGWVIGDLDTCDNFCSLLSKHIGAHVVSLDYRLAPEHKFPTAMEDGFAAYLWLRENSDGLKIDADRIAVGGDSAGGCMTAVLCQEMKRRGKPQPKVQMLIYPATDFTDEQGSMQSCAQCQPLTREVMDWFGEQWLNNESERTNPLANPLMGDVSDDLASALVMTAGFDPLRDQGKNYADRLQAAGVRVRYFCADNLCHAFTAYAGLVPEAQKANEKLAQNLKEMI
jgi:acetyl esterase/lipase